MNFSEASQPRISQGIWEDMAKLTGQSPLIEPRRPSIRGYIFFQLVFLQEAGLRLGLRSWQVNAVAEPL